VLRARAWDERDLGFGWMMPRCGMAALLGAHCERNEIGVGGTRRIANQANHAGVTGQSTTGVVRRRRGF